MVAGAGQDAARDVLVALYYRFPRTALLVCLVFGLLSALGYIYLWQEWRAFESPQRLALADLSRRVTSDERIYATLEIGQWRCETRQRSSVAGAKGRTEVLLTDSAQQVVVVTLFSGDKACADLPTQTMTGELSRLNDSERRTQQERFGQAQDAETAAWYEFCEYCGPTNSLIGMVVCGGFAAGGLLLAGMSWADIRRRERSERRAAEMHRE